jgi:hypothetical protein
LLSFGAESFVFQFAIQEFKDYDIKTYNFAYFLYGCETWSLTMREVCRVRVFENRVLKRIFGPKRDEVTGEWRTLHIEDLNDLNSSPNIVRVIKLRRMRWAGYVARMGERTGIYRVLVVKTKGERPLGRPRHGWIFRKWDVRVWTGSSWLRIGTVGGHLRMRL